MNGYSAPGTGRLHLASASPRRREILRSLGLSFSWRGVDLEERQEAGETAAQMVVRLAAEKSAAGRKAEGRSVVALGADTAVVLDGEVFGKPVDRKDGVRMLMALSGRSHEVLTGVAVHGAQGVETALSRTAVRFRDVDPEEAAAYWQSGEPQDKAGGYAVQGLGGIFVRSLEGSYTGVVGLPVYETARLLAAAGIPVFKPGSASSQ